MGILSTERESALGEKIVRSISWNNFETRWKILFRREQRYRTERIRVKFQSTESGLANVTAFAYQWLLLERSRRCSIRREVECFERNRVLRDFWFSVPRCDEKRVEVVTRYRHGSEPSLEIA